MSRAVRPRNTAGVVIIGPAPVKSGSVRLTRRDRGGCPWRSPWRSRAAHGSRRRVERDSARPGRSRDGDLRGTGTAEQHVAVIRRRRQRHVVDRSGSSARGAGGRPPGRRGSHASVTDAPAVGAALRPTHDLDRADRVRTPPACRGRSSTAAGTAFGGAAPRAPRPRRCTPSSPCARGPRRPCASRAPVIAWNFPSRGASVDV